MHGRDMSDVQPSAHRRLPPTARAAGVPVPAPLPRADQSALGLQGDGRSSGQPDLVRRRRRRSGPWRRRHGSSSGSDSTTGSDEQLHLAGRAGPRPRALGWGGLAGHTALRCCLFLWCLHGYVHPDEHFQGPEVMAGDVFGFDVFRPWEFEARAPCRSVVFPALTSGLPFWVLKQLDALGVVGAMSPETILLAPRLAMLSLTFLLDWLMWRLCREVRLDSAGPLAVLATSYVTTIYHTRPFSNAIESILFAACLGVALRGGGMTIQDRQISHYRNRLILLGGLCAAGVFNRPTFAIFAAAVGAACTLRMCCKSLLCVNRSRTGLGSDSPAAGAVSTPPHSATAWWGRALAAVQAQCRPTVRRRFMFLVLFLALGFLPVALALALADSLYFGALQVDMASVSRGVWPFRGHLTLTPLNNALYNMRASNLAEHGLHFRGTHALVNGPLMFGPLYLLACGAGLAGLARSLPPKAASMAREVLSPLPGVLPAAASRHTRRACVFLLAAAGLSLLALSVFPHQEPRFLCPLLVPLCVVFGGHLHRRGAGVFGAWLVLNLALCLFYGCFHQAGVTRAMLAVQHEMAPAPHPEQVHVIVSSTYMPPRHLLKIAQGSAWLPCNNVTVHDVGGAPEAAVHALIAQLAQTTVGPCANIRSGRRLRLFLVAPATLNLRPNLFRHVATVGPHWGAEAPPTRLWGLPGALALTVSERVLEDIPLDNGDCISPVTACISPE